MPSPRHRPLPALLLTLACATTARAVLIPDDALPTPGHDPSPVPVTLAGHSLSDYTGAFGAFLATPISPRYFLTANHITSATTGTFTYNNGTPTPTTYNVIKAGAQDDLAIWKIADSDPDSFSLFAPLYLTQNELAQPLITLGRGTLRGPAITNASNQTIGYAWGNPSSDTSWGSNTVDRYDTDTDDPGFGGSLLAFTFDHNTNDHEAALTAGDSAGPVFVQDPADGVYKLAGVNSLTDGQFSTSPDSGYFDASLFDARGYYAGSPTKHDYIDPATNPDPVPSSAYATRVSTRLAFIATTTGLPIPEPASAALLLLTTPTLLTRRRHRTRHRSISRPS